MASAGAKALPAEAGEARRTCRGVCKRAAGERTRGANPCKPLTQFDFHRPNVGLAEAVWLRERDVQIPRGSQIKHETFQSPGWPLVPRSASCSGNLSGRRKARQLAQTLPVIPCSWMLSKLDCCQFRFRVAALGR
jgi:hypothetical protein